MASLSPVNLNFSLSKQSSLVICSNAGRRPRVHVPIPAAGWSFFAVTAPKHGNLLQLDLRMISGPAMFKSNLMIHWFGLAFKTLWHGVTVRFLFFD